MSNKTEKWLVIITATILLLAGAIMYTIFDKKGYTTSTSNNYVNYNVNDYVEIYPITYDEYSNVYSDINVSKVNIKNIDNKITKDFIYREEEIIEYISRYYKEIDVRNDYVPINTVYSTIKAQINGAVLSVFYEVDFTLDKNIFTDNIKSYIVTLNVDLGTNKILTKEDLLSKFNYSKNYIADKLFNEEVLIDKGQIVIDKDTNISLTQSDIERKKDSYVSRIISEFDNIIDMYIENNSLVLVYDSKELKNIFFDNKFETNIKFRYLK